MCNNKKFTYICLYHIFESLTIIIVIIIVLIVYINIWIPNNNNNSNNSSSNHYPGKQKGKRGDVSVSMEKERRTSP